MKFILIISKEKPKTVAGKDSGVSDRMSDLRLWMCIAWNCRFLVKLFLLIFKDNLFINKMILLLYIYDFNKNVKIRGRKDSWCTKSEVNFSTLNVYCMKVKRPGKKLNIDFWRHIIIKNIAISCLFRVVSDVTGSFSNKGFSNFKYSITSSGHTIFCWNTTSDGEIYEFYDFY